MQAQQKEALAAGATLVGSIELIKSIQKGDLHLSEYPYVVAHPDIMPELISLRGLLKKKFPDPRAETLGMDVTGMVTKCLNGINYRAVKDENQENYGSVKTTIGTVRRKLSIPNLNVKIIFFCFFFLKYLVQLNMPTEHLISNFNSLLLSVNTMRPKRDGKFITRVLLTSPPSKENLKIDPKDFPFDDYVRGSQSAKKTSKSSEIEEPVDDDDAENQEAVKAKN